MAIALIQDVVFRMLTLKAIRLGASCCDEFHAAGLTNRVVDKWSEDVGVDQTK